MATYDKVKYKLRITKFLYYFINFPVSLSNLMLFAFQEILLMYCLENYYFELLIFLICGLFCSKSHIKFSRVLSRYMDTH